MACVCVVAVVEFLLAGIPGAADVPATLIPDPRPIKTRFISFSSPFPGQTALRVHLTSLHRVGPPYTGAPSITFAAFEGQHVWVGPPATYLESSDFDIEFHASFTQCTPYYHEWGTVGLLHVTGPQIVPSSIYHVEAVHVSCLGNEDAPECQPGGANVSAQLEIRTSRWGDVGELRNPPSPTVQPDASDIAMEVDKFRRPPDDPPKVQLILSGVPGNPWGQITVPVLSVDHSFSHTSACVDAFRGLGYPYKMGKCARDNSACISNSGCADETGPCEMYCP